MPIPLQPLQPPQLDDNVWRRRGGDTCRATSLNISAGRVKSVLFASVMCVGLVCVPGVFLCCRGGRERSRDRSRDRSRERYGAARCVRLTAGVDSMNM